MKAIDVSVSVTYQQIGDQLSAAFEGGSNYWYMIEDSVKPPFEVQRFAFPDPGGDVFPHIDYPLNDGGAIIVSNARAETGKDVKRYRLDLAAIRKGLAIMAAKYPRMFAELTGETGDANTGDVFLQCCLFGELVYG